jgi:hypothetical protein
LVSFKVKVKEKHPSRNIDQLHHNNEIITNPERIIQIMQDWYAHTADFEHLQNETLPDFLTDQQLELPQIDSELQDMLIEEITPREVEDAIKEAKERSAPGPSGHTITLYKPLFPEIPGIFTSAMNQLVFNNELVGHQAFQWIKHRKVIYIPKKPNPLAPGDFRPLGMLEVLYNIPLRIIAQRLSRTLPTIIGEHQHGFMVPLTSFKMPNTRDNHSN